MNQNNLPFLARMFAPVEGTIKARFEDFVVKEIPAYHPCDEGDHSYFEIEKRGRTTNGAIKEIANALGTKPGNIGCAGMKDARAVTRQVLSLEHVLPEKIAALSLPQIKILWVKRHKNKLKTGHLRGNEFIIKLRDVDISRLDDVRSILRLLEKNGVPNYFGPQRFGARGDTWEIGKEIIKGNFSAAANVLAGNRGELDTGSVSEARRLFDERQYYESAAHWPRGYGECVALCRNLARWPDNPKRAILGLGKRTLSFYASAFQAHLFNKLLAARIDNLNTLVTGDLAWKHDKGVVFKVEDSDAENLRCERGEISPSGPMFGGKMTRPEGETGKAEQAVLDEAGVTIDDFPRSGPLKCTGGRRAMRFFPESSSADAGEDEHGAYIKLKFDLKAGCYATVLLREICKDKLKENTA